MNSKRFQAAFKLSLAMVLSAWISMAMGWENPKWALFAVAFCFLPTGGETLAKGLMRLSGTLVGGTLTLVLLALFAQDRWLYAAATMAWLLVCSWRLAGNSRIWYFWFVGGFTVVLMTEYSHLDSKTAFDTVALRVQQTSLGVVVYTLVESFLFPSSARDGFKGDLRRQVSHVRAALPYLYGRFNGLPDPAIPDEEARKLRHAAIQLQTMLTTRLDGATVDSFDMLERRGAWQRAVVELGALIEALDRWRLTFDDLRDPERPDTALPDLGATFDEIARRLNQTDALLAGASEIEGPRPVSLPKAGRAGGSGDPFAEGALAVSLRVLAEVERASRALLLAVADGQGLAVHGLPRAEARPGPPATLIPDPERLAIALRAPVNFLIGFLAVIYVPDIPGASMVVMLSTNTVLFLTRAPAIPTTIITILGAGMILMGAILHIFIMPHLTAFPELAAVLFILTFALTWTFDNPRLVVGRTIGLAMILVLMQLENRQTYSFTYVANLAVAFLIPFGILWLTAMFPVSFRPEDAFRRLLRRYLRACLALLADMTRDRAAPESWWSAQVRAWHLGQVNSIPPRLGPWLAVLPPALLPADDRPRAEELVEALEGLSHRITDLFVISRNSPACRDARRTLLPGITAWGDEMARLFVRLRDAPETLANASPALGEDLSELKARARDLIERHAGDGSPEEERGLLSELAALRGVTEAAANVLRPAGAIDWLRLREARL